MGAFGRTVKVLEVVESNEPLLQDTTESRIKELEAMIKSLEERLAYIEYHSYKKREYRDPKVS